MLFPFPLAWNVSVCIRSAKLQNSVSYKKGLFYLKENIDSDLPKNLDQSPATTSTNVYIPL